MKADVLVAEIGSTTTVVGAFNIDPPLFLGQGQAATSVLDGDVRIGLAGAIRDLERNLGQKIEYKQMLAASSAAGGLKMCVHGLVYDMTVRAAKEAALGAGAVLKLVTAGKLTPSDIQRVKQQSPNIILVAGGVDYGERETALFNFGLLASACPSVPFIYAGNIQNRDEIRGIAQQKNIKLYITENVYPAVDRLNVEPARAIIQDVFEEHITNAAGMAHVRDTVSGKIMPTPGAVMAAARLLHDDIGDLVVFDVGGATTDLHSVTAGSPEISAISISPEPVAKRTVEGDLGVFVNAPHIIEKIVGLKEEFLGLNDLMKNLKPIPQTDEEKRFVKRLTRAAAEIALDRHAGFLQDFYGPSGKKTIATGKDLTAVRYVVGTGGALTRLNGEEILKNILTAKQPLRLYPPPSAKILIDRHYIMASLGVLSAVHKDAALTLLKQSLGEKL